MDPEPKLAKMTGWYDPGQLAETALKVVVSNLFGTRSDYRLIESFTAKQEQYDYSNKTDIRIDYVADLGDGRNSTFAVARTIAERLLSVSSPVSFDTYRTTRATIDAM